MKWQWEDLLDPNMTGANPNDIFQNVGWNGPSSLGMWVQGQLGSEGGIGGGFGASAGGSSQSTLPSRPIFPPGTQGTALPGPTPGSMPSLGPSWGERIFSGLKGLGGSNSQQTEQTPAPAPIGPDPGMVSELMRAAMGSPASNTAAPPFQGPGIMYPNWDELRMRGMMPRG